MTKLLIVVFAKVIKFALLRAFLLSRFGLALSMLRVAVIRLGRRCVEEIIALALFLLGSAG